MSENKILITMNFNLVFFDAWIDKYRLPDGSYKLIGMGRRIEYDYKSGDIVSDKIEPTGCNGWAPHDAFGEPRTLRQWWNKLMILTD